MRSYTNPYAAGVALGLVLLASFAFAGQGLSASGAWAGLATRLVAASAPKYAYANDYFHQYLGVDQPFGVWILVEVLGIALGGSLSALQSGRFKLEVERGPQTGRTLRLATAFGGGAIMGLGAVFARGCTSGQALSGGALLSAGSWSFMIAVFVAGYATAPLFKRFWL